MSITRSFRVFLFLLFVISLLESVNCKNQNDSNIPDNDPLLKNGDKFDYIVVGAGSAGSVVANRLSENSNWRVLLLEAGTTPSFNTKVPGLFTTILNSSEVWIQTSEPQAENCQALRNKTCILLGGKVFGGSSSTNIMFYVRGNPRDYDHWAKLGNEGWDFDSVLPYFMKSEDNTDFWENKQYHGKGGYLTVSKQTTMKEIKKGLLAAARDMGWRNFEDLFDGIGYTGFGDVQCTIKNGQRCSTYEAFLKQVSRDRPNFYLVGKALVTRVLSHKGPKAVGVEVEVDGKTLKIFAEKEVILSAGALGSSKLLMLSGIGPKQDLQKLKIDVVKDLKVGENLQDHLLLMGLITTFDDHDGYATNFSEEMSKWMFNGTGHFSNLGLATFQGFINLEKEKFPNIQIINSYFSKFDGSEACGIIPNVFNYNDYIVNAYKDICKYFSILSPVPILLNPESRGYVKLRSSNSRDPLLIKTNYLSKKKDLETFIKAINFLETLYTHPRLSEFNPHFFPIDIPNSTLYKLKSPKYWEWFIRNMASSVFHLVGTCKMGPPTDKEAVVDNRLRVYGVNSLRVIDASIMPVIPSGNTNAPTIMIGEKGADLIKEDWGFI